MPERVRWTSARPGPVDRTVLVEFQHSPDYEPVEVVVDEQPDYVGLVLHVGLIPGTTWERQSLERHVAEATLPFDVGGRPLRDARPRRPADGVSVPARRHLDPLG